LYIEKELSKIKVKIQEEKMWEVPKNTGKVSVDVHIRNV
jgi:hypothetical protein